MFNILKYEVYTAVHPLTAMTAVQTLYIVASVQHFPFAVIGL